MYVCTCTYTYVITMCIHNVLDTYILSGRVMHMVHVCTLTNYDYVYNAHAIIITHMYINVYIHMYVTYVHNT